MRFESNTWRALLAAVCVVSALVFFYLALESGEASKVVPVSAAYPAVTLLLSAIFLAQDVSLVEVGGWCWSIGGVVLLSVAD